MIRVAEAIEKALRRMSSVKKIKSQMLIDAWPEAAGEKIAAKTSAVSFAEDTLFVWVQDSVWAQHVSLHKKMIIRNVNRIARTRMLLDVRFRVGGTPPPREEEDHEESRPDDWRLHHLEQADVFVVEQALDGAGLEAELKEKLRELLISQKKRVRWLFKQGCVPCCSCGLPATDLVGGDGLCDCCHLERESRAH
ncbi:MAG: DUF721 domain-containing protein [Dethiobacter sp.]|nr:DUF721 domain-containing protein [Dethiobacter sp.]